MQGNNGGRPQKIKISLTPESLGDILSKAYAESQDLRQKSIAVFNKSIRNMGDNADIALVGKTNAEYLKIAANATSATLDIARIIKDYIQKDKTDDTSKPNEAVLTNGVKEDIYAMMKKMKEDSKKLESGDKLNQEISKIQDAGIKKIIEGEAPQSRK